MELGTTDTSVEDAESKFEATRRLFLAAGGTLALGGLAGCSALDDLMGAASDAAVGTTSASPAAFYSGQVPDDLGEDTAAYQSSEPDVRYVPATVQAEGQQVELEGWSVSSGTRAQDYNSSRSNKPSSIWVPDPVDDDDDGDGIPTLATVLDVERALGVYVQRALEGVESRSTEDTRQALDAFGELTTGTLRPELDRCSTERCAAIRESSDVRWSRVQKAGDALDADNWDEAGQQLRQVRRIVQRDIETIRGDLDSDGDGLADGIEEADDYLGDEPTIGERFVVTLPAATLPGDNGSVASVLTPQRVVDYFLGERDADGCVDNEQAVLVHRDLACRTLLTTRLDEQKSKNRHVAAFSDEGNAVVTGATPGADGAAEMVFVGPEGAVRIPENLESWGQETTVGETTMTATLVCPAMATPADCPCPLPALFYVRRLRRDDQIIFAGGWLLDDGALYEDTATLLAAGGPTVVASVSRSDIDEGGVDLKSQGDDSVVRKKPGRTKYGNITLDAAYDPTADHLPADVRAVCLDGETSYFDVQSRYRLALGGGDCDDTDGDVYPTSLVTALDAPILQLTGATEASKDVKFKAGAELSKAVN